MSEPSVGVPAIALVTTVHVALAAVRNHRSAITHPVSSLAVASATFASLPWWLPAVSGLVVGLMAHVCWFVACERWLARQIRPAGSVSPPSRTAGEARVSARAAGGRPSARPARAAGFVQAPVLSVLDETPDIRTFRLARPQGFDFAAGQFLAVRLRTEGREHVRCYSISSPPEASGYLEISVKRQGLVSGALHATVRPGSLLTVRPPAGAFRYPDDDDRPLLLVAGGVGITPLLSMLRHAAYTEPSRPATLLYSVRHECDLAFRDELQLLARRSPRIRVICAVSRGSDAPDLYPGRIDESLLRTVPDLEQSVALICGPEGLIDAVRERLAVIGVPPAQIRFERFDPAVAASSRARANGTPSRDEGSGPFCIRTASGGRRITIESGETLLEAAEREGLDIPSICRAGVCGTCRTRVLEGDVECTSDLLDADERGEGYVLACVSSVRSDCVIEG